MRVESVAHILLYSLIEPGLRRVAIDDETRTCFAEAFGHRHSESMRCSGNQRNLPREIEEPHRDPCLNSQG